MKWLKLNWPLALYVVTALNYAALVALPLWLGKKISCTVILPDLSPFFSADDFKAFKDCLGSLGTTGIDLFGRAHTFGADLTFPALFSLCLITLTRSQARRLPRFVSMPAMPKTLLIAFMPLAYAVSDYVENMLVWQWLASSAAVMETASITVATTLKFAFLAVALAILGLFTLAKLKYRHPS